MRAIVLGLMVSLAPVAMAEDGRPSPEEAKKVAEYFYHGKGKAPVLMETKVCRDVQKEGDEKFECSGDVTGKPVKKGQAAYVWMAYMAPDGAETQNVTVAFELNGAARITKNAKFDGLLRGRTWLKYTFDKPGTWKVKIALGAEELGTREITVE